GGGDDRKLARSLGQLDGDVLDGRQIAHAGAVQVVDRQGERARGGAGRQRVRHAVEGGVGIGEGGRENDKRAVGRHVRQARQVARAGAVQVVDQHVEAARRAGAGRRCEGEAAEGRICVGQGGRENDGAVAAASAAEDGQARGGTEGNGARVCSTGVGRQGEL